MHRLEERLDQLIGRPLGDREPLAVAVSGGPDSLALLWMAHEALGERLHAVTVDHGLRAASAGEAAQVAALCRDLGVPHATLRWEGARPAANIQAAARAARYRLIADWCADRGIAWLATAHHADDQAETLLMRLARGAGVAGLSAIRSRRTIGQGVTLLRPLLDIRRHELAAVVAEAGLSAIDDPSNHERRYDRVRARAWLRAQPELDAAQLAASAAHLADAEAALAWTAELAWNSRATDTVAAIDVDAAGLPREIQRRLLVRAIERLGGATPRGPDIDNLLRQLESGKVGTLAGVRAEGRDSWRLRAAPPRRSGAAAR